MTQQKLIFRFVKSIQLLVHTTLPKQQTKLQMHSTLAFPLTNEAPPGAYRPGNESHPSLAMPINAMVDLHPARSIILSWGDSTWTLFVGICISRENTRGQYSVIGPRSRAYCTLHCMPQIKEPTPIFWHLGCSRPCILPGNYQLTVLDGCILDFPAVWCSCNVHQPFLEPAWLHLAGATAVDSKPTAQQG